MIQSLPNAESAGGTARPRDKTARRGVICACRCVSGTGGKSSAEGISADKGRTTVDLRVNVGSFGNEAADKCKNKEYGIGEQHFALVREFPRDYRGCVVLRESENLCTLCMKE